MDAKPKSDWDAVLGPFFDREGLLHWTSWSESRLDELVATNRVIELVAADGATELYPRFQFSDRGALLKHLDVAWPLLTSVVSPWTAAAWLNAPDPDLDGRTAAEVLRDGDPDEVESVLREARQDAGRMRF